MNLCPNSGYLVGPATPLPTDPTDFALPALPTIGCNRLHCHRCGTPVRHTLPSNNPAIREYFCRCSQWTEPGVQALDDDDPEAFRSSPPLPWVCEGHPLITLPHDIDGALANTPSALTALATAALHGTLPPRAHPADITCNAWLSRLHARLTPDHAALLTAAATEALEDSTPHVRSRALRFFLYTRITPPERLLHLLTTQPGLFHQIEDPAGPTTTLDETAWRILARQIPTHPPVRDQARAAALSGHGSGPIYYALAEFDADWFLCHTSLMARANPATAEQLYDSFTQLPEPGFTEFTLRLREGVRAIIADSLTLEEAFQRTPYPLVTWDCAEYYSARLNLYRTSNEGATLIKSAPVERAEIEPWNEKARRARGQVGVSHTHSEVVWTFDDADCGIWSLTRRLLRGDRRRLLLEGSYVPTTEIAAITTFFSQTPEAVHRGVRCTLTNGEQRLIHEEHDNDPPTGPDYSGEAVHWESAWVGVLATDLATWLGIPYRTESGIQANTRQLEVRARLLALAESDGPPQTAALGTYHESQLSLLWEPDPEQPETATLTLRVSSGARSWPRILKRGTKPEVLALLRHFITPRRILNHATGGC